MSVLTNGPEALAAVAALSAPKTVSVRSGRPAAGGRILLAADETSLDALVVMIGTLSDSARGQVFVEVASADEITLLQTPDLVTVAWLTRESRSGNPGTSRRCAHGQALERAVTAWVSEMCTGDAERDGGELTAWVEGSGTRIYELRQTLIETLGASAPSESSHAA
ncbi:hypothetical protein B7R54_10650 [Subtercola boreus]|uniref:SIP-like Rossmann fold domain-containing protein n=1 Tax=Subtercola boreus TaxID=120213 RepID=A0A3E0VL81_9MICO|nr:SIP domain-containing protein [Subtercola boreus]RFA09627.1 hypothetical protein B7R54_10650 [Subtercola boreus]TQL53297.1 siderophore-interacting protein [Subtercola boreus]